MSSSEDTYSILYAASFRLASSTFIVGISWGIMTTLYVACMHSLLRNFRSSGGAPRSTKLLAGWITIMWVFSSLSTIASAYCAIYAHSWQMNYPGGPAAYLAKQWSQPLPSLAVWAYTVATWFADGLVLWRLAIFYHGVHPLARGLALSFASLMYVGVIVVPCFGWMSFSENDTLHSELVMKVTILTFALSMALSVLVTTLISIRLLLFNRWMRKTLGHEETRASPYTSTAAMLIESAALYATWSVVFIILYVMDNPGQYVMLLTLCNVQVICPVLIVYRVSRGLGWEETTSAKLASMSRMSFAQRQVASVTTLETPDTPENQQEKIPDMVPTSPSRRAARPEAA